jgi:4-hydroxy 2-oxovalerate aldolase
VRPIYQAIQDVFVPLREEIEWGFNDIYGISGYLNQHPRDAMKQRADEKIRDDCYDFYLESRRIEDAELA